MYYAVKEGRRPGVYPNWNLAKRQVNGYSGAVYKKFNTLKEARNFIAGVEVTPEVLGEEKVERAGFVSNSNEQSQNEAGRTVTNPIELLKEEVEQESVNSEVEGEPKPCLMSARYDVYVDGSFNAATNVAGFGVIVLLGDEVVYKNSMPVSEPSFISARNVAGEAMGVIHAIQTLSTNGVGEFNLYYDYEGLERWAKGEWEAKTPIAMYYKQCIDWYTSNGGMINFFKVKAHTGVKYNEEADLLAKSACGM